MIDRIEPTPEDLAIFERNVARLSRWTRTAKPTRTGGPNVARLVGVMKNAVNDYLEFVPGEKS